MPWSRSKDPNNSKAAKALRLKWETEGPDNRLFDACFRIQREAIEAKADKCRCWETHSGWCCKRCYIPLVVENVRGAQPWVGRSAWNYGSFHLWGDVPALMPFSGGSRKRTGRNFHTHALTNGAVSSPSFHGGEHETRGVGMGTKAAPETGRFSRSGIPGRRKALPGSKSNARKMASAMIAKIPFELAAHIARTVKPR